MSEEPAFEMALLNPSAVSFTSPLIRVLPVAPVEMYITIASLKSPPPFVKVKVMVVPLSFIVIDALPIGPPNPEFPFPE